jgi:hypothetical protein
MSYSHADEDLRNQLEKHLSVLRRQGTITTWNDRRIGPGADIHGQIKEELERADIVLLLVSADFLGSDYCYDVEMGRALERHHAGLSHVIPVILRPCAWLDSPFAGLRAVPLDGKPVVKYANVDEAFVEVVEAVRQVAISGSTAGDVPEPFSRNQEPPVAPSTSGPRSSDLRVKREFSDRERHQFLLDAFEYVAAYFENSLAELHARNAQIEGTFRRIDRNSLEATAYRNGQECSRCGIWVISTAGRSSEIRYSHNGVGSGNSYNESMTVADDDLSLFLEPLGMARHAHLGEPRLSYEGAAECFWNLFIEGLRR